MSKIPKVRRIQMDCTETPEAHVFKADLPGINKEEIIGWTRSWQVSAGKGREEYEETRL